MPASKAAIRRPAADDIDMRTEALDWAAMASSLDAHGCAVTGPLLTAEECEALFHDAEWKMKQLLE